MSTSHLVMGELTDFLTGQTLPDTHDERILQTIARFLVEEKGYAKTEIESRQVMRVSVDGKSGVLTVHFVIRINGTAAVLIMYGPGSVVTRQRPTLAVARLFEPHVIPYAMITNGTEADFMDVGTGKVIGNDLNSIFARSDAMAQITKRISKMPPDRLSPARREKEERILYTMDILTHNECSEYVCPIR
jgi:hypothetical protein